ncbi:hypothetical protein [uncultured Gammaproteobacteria bacterium]|nr:hypothetical protein [uncultured Gammaproteobacteria bacterium]VVH63194.1 hypothetical protein BSPWISOX_1798 [uncultured Gammaproteobacteria bacterium]
MSNITKSHILLSSAFKQFKHFFALSLLITFSLNAFSVDDPQQLNKEALNKEEFNKEAYLDLSKPYQQNNPQSAKQDNQATTILKEVAGAARTALGSTNSGNTDQLGKKVATDIKNQAINKTEGLVNDKANAFLNAFGAGRSEVSIDGMKANILNYSIKTIQPLSELNTNSKELTFFQGGIASNRRSESNDSRRTTINLGIGHRLLVEDDMAIVGINVFTDYETKSRHRRLSLGLEYQRTNFSANINKYHILSGKKVVNAAKEAAWSGYDVKFSGQAPYLPWAKIKGTYYHWDTKTGPNIKGNILGVDIELTPSVSFEFGQENNNTMNATNYGKLTVKLPLGNKQKSTNFAIASKAFKDSRKMDLGELAWVERNNKIKNSKILFHGLAYSLVTSPRTKRVWLDRNLGARQVCTSSTDADCFGDYYQWGRAKDGHESSTSGTTTILASSITTPAPNKFIIDQSNQSNQRARDWTKNDSNDSNGALRIAAWKDGGVNDICPAGFSVPSTAELKEDTLNSDVKNTATAFSSFLKLPAAGSRNGFNGDLNDRGSVAFLWVGAGAAKNSADSDAMKVTSNSSDIVNRVRTRGGSIRCIKDL